MLLMFNVRVKLANILGKSLGSDDLPEDKKGRGKNREPREASQSQYLEEINDKVKCLENLPKQNDKVSSSFSTFIFLASSK